MASTVEDQLVLRLPEKLADRVRAMLAKGMPEPVAYFPIPFPPFDPKMHRIDLGPDAEGMDPRLVFNRKVYEHRARLVRAEKRQDGARRFVFHVAEDGEDEYYPATLVDLPTVVETHRTRDMKQPSADEWSTQSTHGMPEARDTHTR